MATSTERFDRAGSEEPSFKEPIAPTTSTGFKDFRRSIKKVMDKVFVPPPHMATFSAQRNN